MVQRAFLAALMFSVVTGSALAQTDSGSTFEVYGFAMMDAGYNARQIHPDWYDVIRPTKLPSVKDEFGTDGNTYFSARQTRR